MTTKLYQHNEYLHLARQRGADEALPQTKLGMRLIESTLDLLAEEDSPWYETEEEIQAGIERGLEKAEQLDRIQTVMRDHLTESQIEVIELRYFQGLTLRQIAKTLGRNPSSILRRLQRAKDKLKAHLAPPE